MSSDQSVLELEHAIGFSGNVSNSLFLHPNGKDYVYVAGGCIVICDLNDPTNQIFLRGHDDNITCLAISKTGKYIASGQIGANADVCVWDFLSKQLLYRLTDHDHGLSQVAFTEDEKLLASVGDNIDRRLLIWDMSTGNIVSSHAIQPAAKTLLAWGGLKKDIKRRDTKDYLLATASNQSITLWTLDPYQGTLTPEKLSTGSFIRDYTTLEFSSDREYLYAGSESGDISCFNIKNKVLNSTIRASSGGVRSLRPSPFGVMYVGGGDGSIIAFVGEGRTFTDDKQTALQGAVTSLSLSTDGIELLAGTTKGLVCRIRTRDFEKTLLCENHEGEVTAIEFPVDVSDKFATVGVDGTVRFWDGADYSVIAKAEVKSNAKPTCITYVRDVLFTGWSDGSIKTFDSETGEFLWDIKGAHRCCITAIKSSHNTKFIVSGGEDGGVRVWEVKSRELVMNFKEHTSAITGLEVFDNDAHILSCSKDRTILCFDLKRERRIAGYSGKMGSINSVALCKDQTQLISIGQDKKITYWDLRQSGPTKIVEYSNSEEPTCLALSHDNQVFACGGTDQLVKLYDFESGQQISSGVGHSGNVVSMRFSPDDKQLISVGTDGCIFVWNIYL